MSSKPPIGDKDVLQRRQKPVTQKYDHVQAVVETGRTAEVAQYIRQNEAKVKRQPGELFRRVRTSTIADYVQRKELEANGGVPERLPDGGFAKPMDEYGGACDARRNSDSQFDVTNTSGRPPVFNDFLILDCRTAEEYEQCHIAGALHFPKLKLNHATNPFLSEMYSFKNKEGKLIVLYDLDESLAVDMANVVYQKGIDNVGMIAGGLKEFVQDYSQWIVGQSPVPIVPRDERLKRRADEITLARSEARSSVYSHKPKSLSSSLAKPQNRKAFY